MNGARTARLTAFWSMATVLAAGSAFLLIPLAARIFVRAIVLMSSVCVQFAVLLSAGVDTWTILATIGRSAGGVLVSTRALAVGGGLVLVGAIALYGLQRLLGYKEESSR